MYIITARELVYKCCEYLEKLGYDKHSIWANSYVRYIELARYIEGKGRSEYDPILAEEYLASLLELYDQGKASYSHVRGVCKAIDHMNEFASTGHITRLQMKKGTKYKLNEAYEKLVQGFLLSKEFHPNTREDFVWAIRMFLFFLQEKGTNDINDLTEEDMRKFILTKATSLSSGSLQNVLCYLRQFHKYLLNEGYSVPDSQGILAYRCRRNDPVANFISDEDVKKLINGIDISTAKGKRNMAVILLGATAGIRAADIATLKLADINWKEGYIRVRQNKTMNITIYPLVRITADALRDYILNARPESDCEEVFLRLYAPIRPLVSGASIEHIFFYQCKVAGIKREPFDGRAFHGLRRRLGHNLLLAGNPVSTISQVLGHKNDASARQYMRLDSPELKKCALDFDGIPVERRVLI